MNISDNIHISNDHKELLPLIKGKKLFSVIDKNVVPFIPEGIIPSENRFFLHASESRKSLEMVQELTSWLLEAGADRDSFLLAVGGGITTDITGFTASIYKRGIPFGLVPTTLLAQVDAAIGGKNGVNVNHYKNMLGSFALPQFVYINPHYTFSLPDGVWHCGLAEMIKTFMIADGSLFEKVVRLYPSFRKDEASLTDFIRAAINIKCSIVEQDFKEIGLRRVLNLGHTFGHAIEKYDVSVMHGEAVAIGTILASKISLNLGLLPLETYQQIVEGFHIIGLPTVSPIALRALFEAISKDKKMVDGKICFILPTSIGSVTCEMLSIEQLKSLCDE